MKRILIIIKRHNNIIIKFLSLINLYFLDKLSSTNNINIQEQPKIKEISH